MTTTDAPSHGVDGSPRRCGRRAQRGCVAVFRDPLHTFLVLAIVAGGFCVFAIPWFGGIDEPAHFYRSYQISTGTLVPDEIEGSDFSGACLPTSLVEQVEPYQAAYFRHLQSLFRGDERFAFDAIPTTDERAAADGQTADGQGAGAGQPGVLRCASADESPLTFSTFGSPVPYLPQTASVLLGRALGMSAGPMLILGRIVMLAVYVAAVGVAIRRTPALEVGDLRGRAGAGRSVPVGWVVARRDHHRGRAARDVVSAARARPAARHGGARPRGRSGVAERAARMLQAGIRRDGRPLPAAADRARPPA